MNELTASPNGLVPRALDASLIEAWLCRYKPTTQDTYRRELIAFAAWLRLSAEQAVNELLAGGPGRANSLALRYQRHLLDAGMSPSRANKALAALRSLVGAARFAGLLNPPWSIELRTLPTRSYRDTRGPGVAGFRAMLAAVPVAPPRGPRDRAILWLLFGMALRRAEVVSLDVDHYDSEGGTLAVLGKGTIERESLTVPAEVGRALDTWIAARGDALGPLFLNLDRAGKRGADADRRLTMRAIDQLVRRYASRAGLRAYAPHALRHGGITLALDTTGNLAGVSKFARHKNPRTTMIYADNLADEAGRVARAMTAAVAAGGGADHRG